MRTSDNLSSLSANVVNWLDSNMSNIPDPCPADDATQMIYFSQRASRYLPHDSNMEWSDLSNQIVNSLLSEPPAFQNYIFRTWRYQAKKHSIEESIWVIYCLSLLRVMQCITPENEWSQVFEQWHFEYDTCVSWLTHLLFEKKTLDISKPDQKDTLATKTWEDWRGRIIQRHRILEGLVKQPLEPKLDRVTLRAQRQEVFAWGINYYPYKPTLYQAHILYEMICNPSNIERLRHFYQLKDRIEDEGGDDAQDRFEAAWREYCEEHIPAPVQVGRQSSSPKKRGRPAKSKVS